MIRKWWARDSRAFDTHLARLVHGSAYSPGVKGFTTPTGIGSNIHDFSYIRQIIKFKFMWTSNRHYRFSLDSVRFFCFFFFFIFVDSIKPDWLCQMPTDWYAWCRRFFLQSFRPDNELMAYASHSLHFYKMKQGECDGADESNIPRKRSRRKNM